MIKPGTSSDPRTPLGWVTAPCVVIGLATLLAFGLTVRVRHNAKGTIAGLGAKASSSGENSLGVGPTKISNAGISISPVATDHFDKLPLAFEPNWGQTDPQVTFLARGQGYTLFLNPREAVFALSNPETSATVGRQKARGSGRSAGSPARLDGKARNSQFARGSQSVAVLRMKLVGANPSPPFEALDQLPGKSNYFIGNRPANWHTNIPNYRKVAELGIYRGIDLFYYGNQRQLENDFVVAPHADPHVIRLAFQGAKNLRTDPQGELVVSVAGGELRLHKPAAYQEAGGIKQAVNTEYVLMGGRSVAFQVGKYDPSRPLVIDPILAYSTFLGGSNIDVANAIAVAADNTAFIAGGTFSANFPTAHPLQPNAGGRATFHKTRS
jgi:hypothetical protein